MSGIANEVFQFLILGYVASYTDVCQRMSEAMRAKGHDTVILFQFLILGYVWKPSGQLKEVYTFNSSFQDTGVGPISVSTSESFNSSFQDTPVFACFYREGLPSFNSPFQDTRPRWTLTRTCCSFNSSFQDTRVTNFITALHQNNFQFLILGYLVKVWLKPLGHPKLSIPHFRIRRTVRSYSRYSIFQFLILGYKQIKLLCPLA